jgi:hypothetical protein
MKTLSKIMLVATSSLVLSTSVQASSTKVPVVSDLEVKLNGFSHFQAGYRSQSNLKKEEKNVSKNRQSFAFYNDAAMVAQVSNKSDGITYGGRIVLVTTAKRKGGSSYNGSHMFVESEFGRVELGSPISAASNMMVDSGSTTVDDWDNYANFTPDNLKDSSHQSEPTFATFAEFFLDGKLTTTLPTRTYSSEPARSISFYTPKFHVGGSTKVQAGITYVPDSSNTGADKPDKNSSGMDVRKVGIATIDRFEIDRTVKDAISAGVAVEQNLTDCVDLKVAFTGEYGTAAGKAKKFATKDDPNPAQFKLSDLRTFNIGAVLNVGNFSYGGSFGSLGKSLTTPEFHKTGRETKYYTGSVAYKQGPFAASISYFKSDQFKNTVDAVSVGTHYVMAPGFKPYFEISGFSLKGAPEFSPNFGKKKTRGTVALIGAKLSL